MGLTYIVLEASGHFISKTYLEDVGTIGVIRSYKYNCYLTYIPSY